jgi:hypothetical protein
MPQCQFLFSAIFVFQKSYKGNILGIGRNESRSSYLPDTKTESKGEAERSQEAATPEEFRSIVNQKNSYGCEQESQDLI